jgi:hypothetical protein
MSKNVQKLGQQCAILPRVPNKVCGSSSMAERHVAYVAVASSSLAFHINYKKVYKSYDQNSILHIYAEIA